MKRLTKAYLKQISDAMTACSEQSSNIDHAIDDYNTALDTAQAAVEAAVTAYNEKLGDLRGIYEEIASEARGYYDERSEKWQEDDAGQQYAEWIDRFENSGLDDLEIEMPDELECPDMPLFEEMPPESPEDI